MKRLRFLLAGIWLTVAVTVLVAKPVDDPASLANIKDVRITHLDLHLDVDFEKKVLRGHVTLSLNNLTGTDTLILDSRGLKIQKVTTGESGQPVQYSLGEYVLHLGRPLQILITPETEMVTVYYETSDDAGALQWCSPEQTAGGSAPFLYSQSQFIEARSWIPLQDSPGVRMTYSATITVPKGYLALMAAENRQTIDSSGIYHFEMPQPIPSYLMALAVGKLEYRVLGERAGVYAEPALVEKAAREFSGTGKMVKVAEDLYGPYQWEQFDILTLPPSFPFGGMENPRLTFATPTIITGDRSLVSVIAHELAHAWSGNLVTNATWNDFWLNEGFTTYFERRITEATKGRAYASMLTKLDYDGLQAAVQRIGPENSATALKREYGARDPADFYNWIPYVKGMFFLRMLEEEFGRRRFDAFLEDYFKTHRFQSVTTEGFLEYLREHLLNNNSALERELYIREWIYEPGIPANCPVVSSPELERVANNAKQYLEETDASVIDTSGWTARHWDYFFSRLPDTLSMEQMAVLDEAFGLTESANARIQREWYQLAIHSGYGKAYTAIREYLLTVGRISLIRPVYRALASTKVGAARAQLIYESAKSGYHPMTREAIERVLGP
ncbi:MAG: M1 family metallopeptidase [Candidatus Marinimicrobia bacterium]|nr:M1 family metallopeptidase [Candidatus Neomarinimicrobiota bacterium]MCF7828614.1 M1 family metallopeptidase [Candidatus Neomarinimicrobiota bacterium]MCF7880355.1 M1 family metallopeptidase [Candidatus Neomarinimicrobiota bacterium]